MKLQIKTTYIGPTDTRGSRIKATFNGKTVSIVYDYALNSYNLHAQAASVFAAKHGLTVGEEGCGSHEKGYFFPILAI